MEISTIKEGERMKQIGHLTYCHENDGVQLESAYQCKRWKSVL